MFLLFPQAGGNIANYFLITAMIAVFGFGVIAGLRFAEDETNGLNLLRWFFAIQIPILSSPIFSWQMGCGFAVNLSWIGGRASIYWKLGSELGVWILQDRPWGVGVNVFALFMFLWTRKLLKGLLEKPNQATEPTPPPVTVPAGPEPRRT